jgi:DNA helicase-2/ATP-dependent DNA helicase PcrA
LSTKKLTLDYLWSKTGFKPNKKQELAIKSVEGPLFLTAGPGSGKTRVLLWRTLNLIVFNNIHPKEIFLSTFTEKAALQLKDGLRSLLGHVTNVTGTPYDISGMALGTVHSICLSIFSDRRFSDSGDRIHPPVLMEELSQYFYIYNKRYWTELCLYAGFEDEPSGTMELNRIFTGFPRESRHLAATKLIELFNRFSEECLDPDKVKSSKPEEKLLLKLYRKYLYDLNDHPYIKQVDFFFITKICF